GPNWAVLAFITAIGSVVISGITWFQLRSTVDDLKSAQLAMMPSIDIADAPSLGPESATVTLVEFSDYECPFCIRHFQQTMPRLVRTYIDPGRIAYVFRDWPVDELHPQSIRAHEAAHCAREQRKFWEIHPRLFGPPGTHTPELLTGVARDVGLDMGAFAGCIDAKRSDPAIRHTSQMAVDLGATGTPSFFVGVRDRRTQTVHVLKTLSGAQPFEVFAEAIDGVLARAR
ncbi:MAG TPA: thioredoxin domain-containing protein, partial [Vicinamibacterales bacterium]|nr:thioredoxin domain-containing protein [Vicinamibacterales bacterium]